MKSQQLSLFALVACFCVLLATALPMDTPSGSKPDPRLSTETAVKDTFHSSDAYFGSEEHYVENVKECDRFKENPSQKNSLKTIYVTSQVFMACQFNPTDFPHLRNVNIAIGYDLKSQKLSDSYNVLFEDPGLIAMKHTNWTNEDPFILNAIKTILNPYPLEFYLIKEGKPDWAKFFLKHRDWKRIDDPFEWWDEMLSKAAEVGDEEIINLLYQIDEKYSIRRGRDPLAMERAIVKDISKERFFKGRVNAGFLNALIAVKVGNLVKFCEWLYDRAKPDQISRMLADVIFYAKDIGPLAEEVQNILIDGPEFDVKFRHAPGVQLIHTIVAVQNWKMFDILISKEGIEVNGPVGGRFDILNYALENEITPERFKKLLDKGADTFVANSEYASPLMNAFDHQNLQFAQLIIEKRRVKNAQGVDEIQLTELEQIALGDSDKFKRIVGTTPIQIVQPQ